MMHIKEIPIYGSESHTPLIKLKDGSNDGVLLGNICMTLFVYLVSGLG